MLVADVGEILKAPIFILPTDTNNIWNYDFDNVINIDVCAVEALDGNRPDIKLRN